MNKKIGIWGFGVVGRSALNYFKKLGYQIEVIDRNLHPATCFDRLSMSGQKPLSAHTERSVSEVEACSGPSITFTQESPESLKNFLEKNDIIIPSPGIDLRGYKKYAHKFLPELDIFSQNWKHKTIAITGTVGKTSIVHLLDQILSKLNLKISTGGNIGTGMLDFLNQDKSDYALLELSSFQLEYSKEFNCDIAIWTNLYQNHLDRHGNLQEYFEAKCKILSNQKHQISILPIELADKIKEKFPEKSFIFICDQLPDDTSKYSGDTLFFFENNKIVKLNLKPATYFDSANASLSMSGGKDHLQVAHAEPVEACSDIKTALGKLEDLPEISYRQNWLTIAATCDALGLTLFDLKDLKNSLNIPEHRLEKVAKINGITFYNDSKSTIMEATQAAVKALSGNPIHLMLGGVSKGVDRKPLIKKLSGQIKAIYTFGKEAKELAQSATDAKIENYAFDTLDQAFEKAVKTARPGDIVLLSPAGASFDLFKNYQERGDYFKRLVKNLK